jgi:hypothetical protein
MVQHSNIQAFFLVNVYIEYLQKWSLCTFNFFCLLPDKLQKLIQVLQLIIVEKCKEFEL